MENIGQYQGFITACLFMFGIAFFLIGIIRGIWSSMIREKKRVERIRKITHPDWSYKKPCGAKTENIHPCDVVKNIVRKDYECANCELYK